MATNSSNHVNSLLILNETNHGIFFIHQQVIYLQGNAVLITKMTIVIFLSAFFIYLNSIMFYGIWSKRVLKETPRYILFAHMIINDTIQLFITALLYVFYMALLKLITAACTFVVFVSCTTFRNAPLNLAVMSLERYFAIRFPLRHAEIVTKNKTYVAIGIVWFLGSINFIIDMLFAAVTDPNFLTSQIYCTRENFLIKQWQVDISQGFNVFHFVSVVLIILFTYVSILVTARSVSSKKDSAKRAHRTVLLHLIQLGLCVTSLLFTSIERVLFLLCGDNSSLFIHLRYVNYVIVLILPRCLSPLIYGLRDEALRPLFTYYFLCGTAKVKPSANVH